MQDFYVLSQGYCLPFTMQAFRSDLKFNTRTASSKATARFCCMCYFVLSCMAVSDLF